VRGQVELSDLPAQTVVDEALRQWQSEVASQGSEGALDVEAIFEDAVEDGGSDAVVVVGLGRDIHRPGAKILAAAAARLILGVVDIEVSHLLESQGAEATVEGAFAVAALTALRTGMGFGGAADDTNLRHEHGLCSWGTGVTYRCPRTQALSFKPPSGYVSG